MTTCSEDVLGIGGDHYELHAGSLALTFVSGIDVWTYAT